MRCGKAKKCISASLDGELDDARGQSLQTHLAACPECRAFAAELAGVTGRLDGWEAPEPRWGFAGRVMSRIADGQVKPTRSPGWLGLLRPAPVGLGAAAFCLGVLVTLLAIGEQAAGMPQVDNGDATLAGEYLDSLSEDAVDQTLLALLAETET